MDIADGFWGFYGPISFGLTLLVQILCAVHLFRTGRSGYWLFVILAFPVVGAVVYFMVEVMPDLRRGNRAAAASGLLGRWQRKRLLRRLEDDLAVCDTTANRIRLAEECLQAGLHPQALATLEPCRLTAAGDDPGVQWGLARAYYHTGEWISALAMLDALDRAKEKSRAPERQLLRARSLEGAGRADEAEAVYRESARTFPGEEGRYRYALFLKAQGRREEARALFAEIVVRVRRSPGFYAKRQRAWVRLARKARP